MYIALNLKGVETVHDIEPSYNRLHDKWMSICKIEMPRGTLKILGIDSKDIASYEVNNYTNGTALVIGTNKINF